MSEETASHPPVKILWLIYVLAAFALFAVIAAYSSRMTHTYTDYDQREAAERYANLAQFRAADHKILTTADWVDQAKKTVRIPIDEAMVAELATLKGKPAQSGSAIPVIAPPPATTNAAPAAKPAPSSSATNAAPAAPEPTAKPTP